jgi:hypothetical protein
MSCCSVPTDVVTAGQHGESIEQLWHAWFEREHGEAKAVPIGWLALAWEQEHVSCCAVVL